MQLSDNKNGNLLSIRLAMCIFGFLVLNSAAAKEASLKEMPVVLSETLLRTSSSWDGASYESYPVGSPELTILKITIPANTQLPWHTHPMPNAAYVLSGEITVEKKENGKKKKLTEGQILPEMVGAVHRGVTGNSPAVLLVFYAGTQGMPPSQRAEIVK